MHGVRGAMVKWFQLVAGMNLSGNIHRTIPLLAGNTLIFPAVLLNESYKQAFYDKSMDFVDGIHIFQKVIPTDIFHIVSSQSSP